MKKYVLGVYEKAMPNSLTLYEKLVAAKEVGYDFIELSVDETPEKLSRLDWSKEERDQLVMDMKKVGIDFRSMALSGQRKFPLGSMDEATRIKSLEILEKAIILANDLGIRVIQLAGYDVYYEGKGNEITRKYFLENLQKGVEIAAKYGVLLAFETMETDFMDTVKKAKEVVEYINSPFLMIYPDLGNIKNASVIYNNDVLDDIRLGKGKTVAAHIKESIPGHYREIPFLTGHVNFYECLTELYKIGVRRYVTELWYTGAEDFKVDLRFAVKTFREMLDKIEGEY
ncbi:L-ribulose-5-phosphate 3-epimerase [Oceanivirga miroungae]|uniref:L-ribulose-5-phosphate 3-epimerase n=1 Tax=Oceanivirga miroungae TaxID=1130046 RepID=A0A6I8M735_9FUSO|nr:L-ribulose-5-phosphate 3-epimerase [Oceanivirga miroungae]VWL85684.1 L-ribulose-5-phosphate 3-epimerase UlaE [Oceanivirga miroungae]